MGRKSAVKYRNSNELSMTKCQDHYTGCKVSLTSEPFSCHSTFSFFSFFLRSKNLFRWQPVSHSEQSHESHSPENQDRETCDASDVNMDKIRISGKVCVRDVVYFNEVIAGVISCDNGETSIALTPPCKCDSSF